MKTQVSIVFTSFFIFSMLLVVDGIAQDTQTAKLQVTVVDANGKIVEGASVTIYSSEENYTNSSNAVQKGTSDNKGRVKFTELAAAVYFVDVRTDTMSNDGKGVQTESLQLKKLTKINVVIE